MLQQRERTYRVALARQFSSFLAVGVATTIIHYGVLVALVERWTINPVLATSAGFSTATVLSYLLNRRFTFSERPAFSAGLLKFYSAVSLGLLLNAGTVALLVWLEVHYVVAQLVASGIALFWNFCAARFMVFRRRH